MFSAALFESIWVDRGRVHGQQAGNKQSSIDIYLDSMQCGAAVQRCDAFILLFLGTKVAIMKIEQCLGFIACVSFLPQLTVFGKTKAMQGRAAV